MNFLKTYLTFSIAILQEDIFGSHVIITKRLACLKYKNYELRNNSKRNNCNGNRNKTHISLVHTVHI